MVENNQELNNCIEYYLLKHRYSKENIEIFKQKTIEEKKFIENIKTMKSKEYKNGGITNEKADIHYEYLL